MILDNSITFQESRKNVASMASRRFCLMPGAFNEPKQDELHYVEQFNLPTLGKEGQIRQSDFAKVPKSSVN